MIGFYIALLCIMTGCLSPNPPPVESSPILSPQPQSAAGETIPPTTKVSPDVLSTLEIPIPPSCTPYPLPTGEKVIHPTVEATPPNQFISGQVLTVTFSGGYAISNNAIVCEDNEIIGYAHSDELDSNYNWDRQVTIQLDERVLERVNCDYICQIEVTLPENLSPGIHKLRLPYKMAFEFEIVANNP